MSEGERVPSLFEWAGGSEAFDRLTEQQRARWVQLIGLAADDAGLPPNR